MHRMISLLKTFRRVSRSSTPDRRDATSRSICAERLESRRLFAAAPNLLELRVDVITGAARIVGNASDPAEVRVYQIQSASSSLAPASWNSLADQGRSGWSEFTANAGDISEAKFGGSPDSFDATPLNVGNVFDSSGSRDLVFKWIQEAPGGTQTEITGPVVYDGLPVSISGRVFNDRNATGLFDGDDTGISGFRVFLDTNHNEILDEGETSKPVSATGTFTFSNLQADSYRLRQVSRPGWRVAFPALGHYDVSLNAGDTAKSLSFANTQGVLIKGTVWHDSNQDRLIQSIEAPLARWRVIVDLNKNGIWDGADVSKETNGRGQYRLSLLTQIDAGPEDITTYHVMAKQIEGYRQTTNGGSFHTINLAPGGTTSNKNFGFKRLK